VLLLSLSAVCLVIFYRFCNQICHQSLHYPNTVRSLHFFSLLAIKNAHQRQDHYFSATDPHPLTVNTAISHYVLTERIETTWLHRLKEHPVGEEQKNPSRVALRAGRMLGLLQPSAVRGLLQWRDTEHEPR
jgi:hypothetical protein